jgi:alpha-glucosidase
MSKGNQIMKQHNPNLKLGFKLIVALMVLTATTVAQAITVVGSVSSTQVITEPANGNQKVVFGLSTGGALEVAPYAPDLVRVRYHWDGLWAKEDVAIAKWFDQWPGHNVSFQDDGNIYRVFTDDLEIEVVKSPNIQVHFKSLDGYYLSRDNRIEYDTLYDPVSDPSYIDVRYTHALPSQFKLKAIREMPAGEAYFGFGPYAGPLNRRGHTIQGWNSDTFQWQEWWTPLYMTMPFFYGLRGDEPERPSTAWGIFFNNPARPIFKMGTQWGDKYSFEAADGQIDYFFFGGGSDHEMRNVLTRFTELTGTPTLLPKWAYGYHLSRWSFDNQGWLEWLSQEFRNRDIPLDALYIDLDYMDTTPDNYYQDGSLHQLSFNYNFPNVQGMINYTGERGVKLVPLIEPWLSSGDPKWGEAYSQFHFIKDYDLNQMITPIYFGNVSWIDFSSSPARTWWRGKLVNFLDQYPLAGIWNDLNEPADNEAIPRNGQYWLDGRYANQWDSRRFHLNEKNVYNIRETSLTYEALLEKYPGQRPFVLSRAGYPGIQRYALGWSGDNVASWDHCRHNIRLGTSVMSSGQVNYGHDVGGFVGDPSGELNTRWHEWSSLTPFFRSHSIKGNAEREPWRYGDWYGGKMVDTIKFRYQLMPYLYSLAYQSSVNGIPMNTPTVMHFQQDPETHYQNDYDFMVGDWLLASGVYQQGATERWTYLPSGSDWYDFYTGEKIAGGIWARQDAPLGRVPLYARAGGIVPMGPVMAYANQFQPDFLDLHVWPAPAGFTTSFTLFEDDGESFDYLAGDYAKTTFESTRGTTNFTFVIRDREGSYGTGPRHYYLKARDLDTPTAVTVNGNPIPYDANHAADSCYSYDAGSRMVIVKVPDTLSETTIDLSFVPNLWAGNEYQWPFHGEVDPADNLWLNLETYPQGAAVLAEAVISTDEGTTWVTHTMVRAGQNGNNDWFHKNLGTFSSGTKVWYRLQAEDSNGTLITVDDGGEPYKTSVGSTGPAIVWAGNSEQYPGNGNLNAWDNLWLNIESWPMDSGVEGFVHYSTDGGTTWNLTTMNLAGIRGNNDWWNKNLGTYSSGTQVLYWMEVIDSNGTSKRDPASGYATATVN